MTLVIIALVCSQLATPDRANCMIDTALRHERLEIAATSDSMCELNGMIAAAAVMNIDMASGIFESDVRPTVRRNKPCARLMWHLAVAILLGSQVLDSWQLPRAYANESLCAAQAQTFMAQWGPGNSLHEIGYRCIREPLTT